MRQRGVSSFTLKKGDYVTYDDNNKGQILGSAKVGKTHSTSIENLLLVKCHKHNLLSISQIFDKGNKVIFDSSCCIIENKIIIKLR